MNYGRHEVDREKVDVSMAKVMGASAGTSEKSDGTGGKIMGTGTYKASSKSNDASKLSTHQSGFNGKSALKPNYQGGK